MAQPTTEIAQVIESVAKGDLNKTIQLEVKAARFKDNI
jgi:hypothetical protein